MIYGIDFDGTLCEHAYPNIGVPNIRLIVLLRNLKQEGHKLILWTCRDGLKLVEAVEWCNEHGLEFDAINDDLPEIKESFTFKSQKVYADIYVDDRNVTIKDFITGMEK